MIYLCTVFHNSRKIKASETAVKVQQFNEITKMKKILVADGEKGRLREIFNTSYRARPTPRKRYSLPGRFRAVQLFLFRV